MMTTNIDNDKMEPSTMYLSGQKLYGDDFSFSEIKKWYENEKEGYADLGSKDKGNYKYSYHSLNELYGFRNLPKESKFEVALGVGAAYGDEFLPIIDRLNTIHIIEPSDQLISNALGNITPVYHKPNISGKIDFPDDHFDLITCFSTLHHIPNVSFVLAEFYRCLKPNGILLLKEPISSMGDWTSPRPGLTRDERGIPINLFRMMIDNLNFAVIKESLCFSMTSYLTKLLKYPIYQNKGYLLFDRIISRLLKFRAGKYHRITAIDKIAPSAVYYVLRK